MDYGERVIIDIERLDEKGRGIGTVRDIPSKKPGAVRGVIPGETVEATFVGRDKGVHRLAEPTILTGSPDRVKEACPHAGVCGGCSFQHVSYPRQAEIKLGMVDAALHAGGHADLSASRIHPAERQLHHRNRMDYVFGPRGELGLKEAGRWDRYLDLTTCLMLSPPAVDVLHRTKLWAASTGLPYWNARTYEGFFRYLVIREGKNTGERMATLVTSADASGTSVISTEAQRSGENPLKRDPSTSVGMTPRLEQELVQALAPLCTTIYHGVNPLQTDLSLSSELRLLYGKEHLTERVAGISYRIHPNSFFQTNTGMAERLLEHVRGLIMAGPRAKLLDLYCGGGFFALALAKSVDESLGIELDERNIEMANLNAHDNGVRNVRFRAEAAEALSWKEERPDVVIVDPPRSGLHPKVRRVLLENLPPRIVYVSCNPRALAVDLMELRRSYTVSSCEAFDLFPQTPHVETVVELKRT